VAAALNPGRRHDLGRKAPIAIRSHFLASVFELTGENKRNLINVLK
jgi:hypothetical protein